MPPKLVFCYMKLEDNKGSGRCESFLLVRMGTQKCSVTSLQAARNDLLGGTGLERLGCGHYFNG